MVIRNFEDKIIFFSMFWSIFVSIGVMQHGILATIRGQSSLFKIEIYPLG